MPQVQEHSLDEVFHALGDIRKFEILQFLAMSLILFPSAYQLFSNVFICGDIPHRCAAPSDKTHYLDGLYGYSGNLTVLYDECEITVSVNETVVRTETCLYGMEYDLPRDTSAVSQFDLVCGRSPLGSLSQTLVIAGQGIGVAVFSVLSDRFGRKPVLIASNTGLLFFGLLIAYAPNFIIFAISKLAAGAFQQGAIVTFYTQLIEMLSIKKRRLQVLAAGVMWGLANVSMGLIAFLMQNHSWRTLQMTISLSSLFVIFQFWYVWESLRWLAANGKTTKAYAYLKYGSKLNKVDVEHVMRAYNLCESSKDGTETAKQSRTFILVGLMRSKRLFCYAAVLWFAWMTAALAFFAIFLTSTSIPGSEYLNFTLTAFMEIPTAVMLWILLERYGRKFTLILCFAITSVGLIASGIIKSHAESNVTRVCALISSMISMVGASGAFTTLFFYTPEIFPTNIRNQAVGISSLMSRIGGMIAPFTGVVSESAKWGPGVFIGGCTLLITVFMMFLPETRGRELPQTTEDVLNWAKSRSGTNKENGDCEVHVVNTSVSHCLLDEKA